MTWIYRHGSALTWGGRLCVSQVNKIAPPDRGLMRLDPLDAMWKFVNQNQRTANDILDVALNLAALQVGCDNVQCGVSIGLSCGSGLRN